MTGRRPPTVLAFDYGLRRIGVAVGNVVTATAEPLRTLRADHGEPDWATIGRCVEDWRPGLAVVGVPYNMDGSAGALTGRALSFASALAERFGLEVVTVDERLSSWEAEDALRRSRRAGILGRRVRRADVDKEAARVLLRQWLDVHGARGTSDRDERMQSFSQFDDQGGLRHLITLEGLDADLLRELLDRAQHYAGRPGELRLHSKELQGFTVANLFSEPSTRTRASFELAALRLGADVVNLDMMLSSRAKGESMLDTIYTLQAMQVDIFVIRDAQPGVTQYVAEHVDPHVSVISGGEAHLTHPTQGLLDSLTILQFKGGFRDLVVAIVGDVRHSRVARSAWRAMSALGVSEIRLVGPEELMPAAEDFAGATRFDSLEAGIDHADVVMMLRVQNERMEQARVPDADRYFDRYGLTAEKLRRARPEAIVMHPGPMNRGVEIASEVADGPQSVIRRQVANGVAVRMAVLSYLAQARRKRS